MSVAVQLPLILWIINAFIIHDKITPSKKAGEDQESIQSSTTPDPGYQWESDNFTIRHPT